MLYLLKGLCLYSMSECGTLISRTLHFIGFTHVKGPRECCVEFGAIWSSDKNLNKLMSSTLQQRRLGLDHNNSTFMTMATTTDLPAQGSESKLGCEQLLVQQQWSLLQVTGTSITTGWARGARHICSLLCGNYFLCLFKLLTQGHPSRMMSFLKANNVEEAVFWSISFAVLVMSPGILLEIVIPLVVDKQMDVSRNGGKADSQNTVEDTFQNDIFTLMCLKAKHNTCLNCSLK